MYQDSEISNNRHVRIECIPDIHPDRLTELGEICHHCGGKKVIMNLDENSNVTIECDIDLRNIILLYRSDEIKKVKVV